MTTNLTQRLQDLNCPLIHEDEACSDDIFLETKSLRMKVLQWMFSLIYPGSDQMYTLQPYVFDIHSSSLEVNGTVKAFTKLASSLGLCKDDDYLVILGECSKDADLKFWNSLIGITTTLKCKPLLQCKATVESTQRLLFSYDEDTTFPQKLDILSPVIRKELEFSPRRKENRKANRVKKVFKEFDTSRLIEKSKDLEARKIELNEIVKEKENQLPDGYTNDVNSPEFKTRQRAMDINMTDLFQLTTAYNEKCGSGFRIPDRLLETQKHTAGQFETVISRASKETAKFSKAMTELEGIKSCYHQISSAFLTAEDE